MDKREESRHALPQVFEFYLGGFGGPHHTVKWKDGSMLYTCSFYRPDEGDPDVLHPSTDKWEQFWQIADEMNVWCWPRRCRAKERVLDGTQWHLRITHGQREVYSEGDNAYPFTDECEPSREFRHFVSAVSALLNVRSFW